MEEQLEKDVLRKLLHHKIIGEKHTSINNLPKSFPKHLRGDVKKAAEKLIRKGFLRVKPTSYGLEVSVNPDKLSDIRAFLFLL